MSITYQTSYFHQHQWMGSVQPVRTIPYQHQHASFPGLDLLAVGLAADSSLPHGRCRQTHPAGLTHSTDTLLTGSHTHTANKSNSSQLFKCHRDRLIKCSTNEACQTWLSQGYKGWRQAQEYIWVFNTPKTNTYAKHWGVAKQKSEGKPRRMTPDEISNAQNMQHRLRQRTGTHTTNGHGNNNRPPNGIQRAHLYNCNQGNGDQVCVMTQFQRDPWQWRECVCVHVFDHWWSNTYELWVVADR